jgi:nucleoside 2-deoxyribosyltransferase
MELVTEPDVYSPSIDDNGNYIDKIPSFNTNALANGLRCPCGTRKDKVYLSGPLFAAHCKTKTHEKWVQDLNTNKSNFFTENQKLSEIVHAQKIMIGKMELELASKTMTINYLTHELTKIMTTGGAASGGGGHTATATATTPPSANDMLMF